MRSKSISISCLLILGAGVILNMASMAATTVEGKAGWGQQKTVVRVPTTADDKPWMAPLRYPAGVAELLTLGSTWEVAECCGWTGIWKRRPGTNTFDGSWRHTNGTVVTDTVVLKSWDKFSNQIVFSRTYNNGTYSGILNPGNGTISNGAASWYPAGATWSAKLYAAPEDPKGPVTIPIRKNP